MMTHLRLEILRILGELHQYRCVFAVLCDILGGFGFHHSKVKINSQIEFLTEIGLVEVECLSDDLSSITLTAQGLDVSRGNSIKDGVARPAPKG